MININTNFAKCNNNGITVTKFCKVLNDLSITLHGEKPISKNLYDWFVSKKYLIRDYDEGWSSAQNKMIKSANYRNIVGFSECFVSSSFQVDNKGKKKHTVKISHPIGTNFFIKELSALSFAGDRNE